MPHISVIIVNYNGGDLTQRCLASLDRQTMQDFEVVLVDNASKDGSREVLEKLYPAENSTRVRFLPLATNTGFAGGNNAGVKHAAGEWIVLLNNDAFPDPDWLEALLAASERNPDFDFFTSRQYCEREPWLLDGTGDMLATNGRAWRRDYRALATCGTQEEGEVFSACGAAMMFRRKDFEDAGGFDEDFFCHFEDVDLSFRLRLMGKRCLYVPAAIVYHIGSATVGGEQSSFALHQGMRNSVWCYIKCMPGPLLRKQLPRFLMRNLLDVAHHTIAGHGGTAIKAKWHALTGLPMMLRKRRAVQAACVVAPEEIARLVRNDPGHHLPEEVHG